MGTSKDNLLDKECQNQFETILKLNDLAENQKEKLKKIRELVCDGHTTYLKMQIIKIIDDIK